MAAGKEVTPQDRKNVRQLRRYWAYEEGRQKWVNAAHPYTTLVSLLRKYIENDQELKGFAAKVFHDALGFWPGTPHEGKTPTPGKKRD
jgi:hypothetical protein